jgi:SAM-dependent methyltransferase
MSMRRDYSQLDIYLNELMEDAYPQPPDKGHTQMLREVFHNWIVNVNPCKNVLDVGCGAVCIAEPFFKKLDIEYTGITLGKEYTQAKFEGHNVLNMDMTFLEFPEGSFDLIWARHVVEHSPMPVITLMDFHRVSRNWLCLILPKPEFFGRTGLNHYSVLYSDQWEFLLNRAGWKPIWNDHSNVQEYRFFCERKR